MTWPRIVGVAVVLTAMAIGLWWFLARSAPTVDPNGPVDGAPGTALLIPGHGGNAASLAAIQQALRKAGWSTQVVDIGDGSGDIAAYGRAVSQQAGQAASTGGPVALVGYSEGGLIARSAVASGAGPVVGRVVTIGSPHNGTALAGLGVLSNSGACDTACRQMAPDSDFLGSLPVAGDASRWLAIYSDGDDVVRPADSAVLEGATVARLQDYCPARSDDHGQIVSDSFTVGAVVAFLDSGVVPGVCPAT
jgi:triacylglycerol lipase